FLGATLRFGGDREKRPCRQVHPFRHLLGLLEHAADGIAKVRDLLLNTLAPGDLVGMVAILDLGLGAERSRLAAQRLLHLSERHKKTSEFVAAGSRNLFRQGARSGA